MSKKRFRNYGLWVAVGALIVNILIYANVITVSEQANVENLIKGFLHLLELAGIISNPTKPDNKGFNI
jgi:uncharacterized membrane protein